MNRKRPFNRCKPYPKPAQITSEVLTAEGREGSQPQSPFRKVFSPLESGFLTLWFKIAPVSLSRRYPAFGSVAKRWLSPRTSCSQESHRSVGSLRLGTARQEKNSKGGKKGAFPQGSDPLPVIPSLGAAPAWAAGRPAGSLPSPRGRQARRQLRNRDSPFLRSEQTARHCGGRPGLPTEAAQGAACSGGTAASCRRPDLSSVIPVPGTARSNVPCPHSPSPPLRVGSQPLTSSLQSGVRHLPFPARPPRVGVSGGLRQGGLHLPPRWDVSGRR